MGINTSRSHVENNTNYKHYAIFVLDLIKSSTVTCLVTKYRLRLKSLNKIYSSYVNVFGQAVESQPLL